MHAARGLGGLGGAVASERRMAPGGHGGAELVVRVLAGHDTSLPRWHRPLERGEELCQREPPLQAGARWLPSLDPSCWPWGRMWDLLVAIECRRARVLGTPVAACGCLVSFLLLCVALRSLGCVSVTVCRCLLRSELVCDSDQCVCYVSTPSPKRERKRLVNQQKNSEKN